MILVTGASGLLGQHLLKALALQPLPVIALYNNTRPVLELPGVTWVQCDLLDIIAVEEIINNGITHIYHCAAIVSFDPSNHDKMIQDNVTVTQHILDLALSAGIKKLVHVSSIAALGRSLAPDIMIDEDTHWEDGKNNSAYARSKFFSEMEVWRAMAEGLNAVIINPGIILGEGDWTKGSARLMQIVYDEFTWYTEGVNAWVDVKDVVQAMILLMESDISEERFIISSGNFPYKEVFTSMAHSLKRRPPYKKASKLVTELVWRYEMLKNRITGKEITISEETARTAQNKYYYNNGKFLKQFPAFHYHRQEETIRRMAEAFLSEHGSKTSK